MRSVSPANDYPQLRASYDNVNLVNHLPFADKSKADILKDNERFQSYYREEQAIAANRQSTKQLIGNLLTNNQYNKDFKKRLLDENYKLGMISKAQEIELYKSSEA